MLISLKTQVERTAKTPVTPVAPVSAVCAAFAAQPSAYPPNTRKPDVAPTCGSIAGTANAEKRPAAGEFQQREKPQAAKQPAMDLSRDKNAEKDELVAVGNGRGNAG